MNFMKFFPRTDITLLRPNVYFKYFYFVEGYKLNRRY